MVGGKKDPPEPEADDGGRCVVVPAPRSANPPSPPLMHEDPPPPSWYLNRGVAGATVGRLHERAHQREIDLRRVRFVLLDEADDSLPSSQVESVWCVRGGLASLARWGGVPRSVCGCNCVCNNAGSELAGEVV